MVQILTPQEGNLPPYPNSIKGKDPTTWKGIRVHHTGGEFSTWRSVHDWQTVGRTSGRLIYIGYNFGPINGNIQTLRGYRCYTAHDFINTHLGFCFGGNFNNGLPAIRDLDAFIWWVHHAEDVCKRKLPISPHRSVEQTSCPGDRLVSWMNNKMAGLLEKEGLVVANADDAKTLIRSDGTMDAPYFEHDGTKRDSSENPTWSLNNFLNSLYGMVAKEVRRNRAREAELLKVKAELKGLTVLLSNTSVNLTQAQINQLAEAVNNAGNDAVAEVLARLEAAGEALSDGN